MSYRWRGHRGSIERVPPIDKSSTIPFHQTIPLRSFVRGATNAHDFRGKVNAKSGDRDDGRSGWWSVDDVDPGQTVGERIRWMLSLSLSLSCYALLIEPIVVARWLEFRDIVVCFVEIKERWFDRNRIILDRFWNIYDGKFYSFFKTR